MNTKRLFGVLFLVIALVITQLPVPTVEADNSTSDFQMNGTTLVKYIGTDTSVTIPDGVKIIGAEAFSDCDFIEEFSIPNSVLTIEDYAFSGCSSITVLTLPDTTLSLGTFAFYNCENLKTMYFGDELKTLGEGIFLGCNQLEKIILSDNNINFIRDNGFIYSFDQTKLYFLCSGSELVKYSMPSSVTEISKYAFWGCDNLEEVSFSTSMSEIPAYAFMNCTSLTDINLPYNITSIDMKAFSYCTGLSEVMIPSPVKYIHPTAFDYCENIFLNDKSGDYAIEFFETNKERFSPTPIYELDEVESSTPIPTQVEENVVEDSVVYGSTHIVDGNAMVIVNTAEDTVVTGYNSLVERLYGVDWEKIFLTEDLVNSAAFYGEDDLTGISLPDYITKIEDFSFARSGLEQINIPENITEIGYAAFYHCDSLKEITIPISVKKIDAYAFDKTPWMDSFYNQNSTDYLIVGDGVLIAYNGTNSSISIPDEVKSISAYAFNNHTEITRIIGGINLEYVDKDAFYGCDVSITQKSEEIEIKNSINSSYGVIKTKQIIKDNKYLYMKWILVFGLLVIGILFLSIQKNSRKRRK